MTDPGPTVENPHAGQGAVLLDIGGDVGALVVTMPPELEGFEVEIRPAGFTAQHEHPHDHGDHEHGHDGDHGPGHHPHVAVVNRPTGSGSVPSLVFPEVVAGEYELVPKDGGPVRLTVRVDGGVVTAADWGNDPTE